MKERFQTIKKILDQQYLSSTTFESTSTTILTTISQLPPPVLSLSISDLESSRSVPKTPKTPSSSLTSNNLSIYTPPTPITSVVDK